jgi:hypothetical protein
MLHLNLFHEQQQIQREKDFDPVRLTIVGGVLILLCILLWGGIIFYNSSGLRSELTASEAEFKNRETELKALEPRSNLPKTESQVAALQTRLENRTLFGTQLDILRDLCPTNCQIRKLYTLRSLPVERTTLKRQKGDKIIEIVTEKRMPLLSMTFEIHTRAESKLKVVKIRDDFIQSLRANERLKPYIKQVTQDGAAAEAPSTNTWNEVITVTNVTPDPKPGEHANGIFEFRLPFQLKDKPKE